jgi:hypothetical protein
MKRILLSLVILSFSHAAMAEEATQELSPIQQYLYNESGYAPQYDGTAEPVPETSYDTAYVPAEPVAEDTYYDTHHNLNAGVRGMNF